MSSIFISAEAEATTAGWPGHWTLDTGHWTWDFGLRTLATVVFIGGLLTCANGKSDGKGKASDTLRIRHVGPVVL